MLWLTIFCRRLFCRRLFVVKDLALLDFFWPDDSSQGMIHIMTLTTVLVLKTGLRRIIIACITPLSVFIRRTSPGLLRWSCIRMAPLLRWTASKGKKSYLWNSDVWQLFTQYAVEKVFCTGNSNLGIQCFLNVIYLFCVHISFQSDSFFVGIELFQSCVDDPVFDDQNILLDKHHICIQVGKVLCTVTFVVKWSQWSICKGLNYVVNNTEYTVVRNAEI